jgi:hypothetical protein
VSLFVRCNMELRYSWKNQVPPPYCQCGPSLEWLKPDGFDKNSAWIAAVQSFFFVQSKCKSNLILFNPRVNATRVSGSFRDHPALSLHHLHIRSKVSAKSHRLHRGFLHSAMVTGNLANSARGEKCPCSGEY